MGSSVGDDDDRKQLSTLSEEGIVDVDGEGDRNRRTANWVSVSMGDSISILTAPLKREAKGASHSDAGQGNADAVMKDFEKKLDQIATEYKKSLQDYDYNDDLTLEVEKSKATIQELNKLVKESVAKEKAEELRRKTAEVSKSTQLNKEIADLKKQLKEKDDYNNELTLELEKNRVTFHLLAETVAKARETSEESKRKMAGVGSLSTFPNSQNSTFLEENLTRINGSLLTMSAEIQVLKTQVKAEGETKTPPGNMVKLHRYFNKAMQDHFYTTDWAELGGGKFTYIYEGVIGRVFPSPGEGTAPLFRYWNGKCGNHVYTMAQNEFEQKKGYVYEGICCYIFSSPLEGTKPLVRYYNFRAIDHLLTTSASAERKGYEKDEILGYVY